MAEQDWRLPWLRVELSVRAMLADRLERGPTDAVDRMLATVIAERGQIARAGWFN